MFALMKQNRLIWIVTASESLAANLEELLEMEGYSCFISKDILEMKDGFNEKFPQAFVLDELNNKGGYAELLKIGMGKKNARIIVLCSDNDNKEYPMADSCLGLPTNIDNIPGILSKW